MKRKVGTWEELRSFLKATEVVPAYNITRHATLGITLDCLPCVTGYPEPQQRPISAIGAKKAFRLATSACLSRLSLAPITAKITAPWSPRLGTPTDSRIAWCFGR